MPEEKKDGRNELSPYVHLTIDDIPVAVPAGTLVWAAAQQAGIEIPIYCYHPKMPPLGACRMCFVEIEKLPKPPQTACTTPVSEGMIVHTKTEKVLKHAGAHWNFSSSITPSIVPSAIKEGSAICKTSPCAMALAAPASTNPNATF